MKALGKVFGMVLKVFGRFGKVFWKVQGCWRKSSVNRYLLLHLHRSYRVFCRQDQDPWSVFLCFPLFFSTDDPIHTLTDHLSPLKNRVFHSGGKNAETHPGTPNYFKKHLSGRFSEGFATKIPLLRPLSKTFPKPSF